MKHSNNIRYKVLENLRVLRETPMMILTNEDSYVLLQNYIEGYIDGLSHCLNKNMRKEITKWYKIKIKKETSYYWTGHIPLHFKGKTDGELKKILLDMTEEYFKENDINSLSYS